MTQTTSDVFSLRAAMSGAVLEPGDAGYDEARDVCNGDIDRRPTVIARCTSPDDVAAALATPRPRACGSPSGAADTATGWPPRASSMIDLRPLDAVDGRPGRPPGRGRRRRQLAQLDAATQEHGLAVTAGTVSHTGVGGLTLGGGFGWLTAQVSAWRSTTWCRREVVLADGRCVRASTTEHPDLLLGAARWRRQLRRRHRVRVPAAPGRPDRAISGCSSGASSRTGPRMRSDPRATSSRSCRRGSSVRSPAQRAARPVRARAVPLRARLRPDRRRLRHAGGARGDHRPDP